DCIKEKNSGSLTLTNRSHRLRGFEVNKLQCLRLGFFVLGTKPPFLRLHQGEKLWFVHTHQPFSSLARV
ncbi:hypothetical protein, partial [Marinicella sediminis]|uniref:hypothetical protein n=1 Tax=Marinicella sediminis TaxID=1792834 RepID=UPI001E57FE9B